MDTSGVRSLGHNIPQTVQLDSSTMCAIRVENTLDRNVYFQSHASFYGHAVKGTRFHLSVHVNGVFAKPLLVEDDCLRPRERATLYFPFHAGEEGDYRLQLVIAEQHADPVSREGLVLFDTNLRVTKDPVRDHVGRQIQRRLFTLRHTEIPLRWKARQLDRSRRQWERNSDDDAQKKKAMGQYKEINKQLAFMEKQMRTTEVASLPCYLSIDTTSKCNLECKMCFRSFNGVDYDAVPDLPEDLLDQLIAELFPTAITLNLSTIGEPLMSPYMDKILSACAEHQVYLSMTTNGTLLRGEAFIRKLASVLHHVEISVDSTSPGRFKAYRSGASYEKVLHNAAQLGAIRRALPDPKFSMGFSMTLFEENLEEVPEMIRIVSEVGGNFLKADIGVIFSKKDLSQSVLTWPERYNEMYAIAQERARDAGIKLMMRAPFSKNDHTKAVKYGICDFLYVSAVVKSEGTLSPCYFGPALLGVKDTFRSAWNSEVMQRLRTDHDTGRGHSACKNCYVFTDGGASVENRKKQFLKGDALTAT